MDFTFDSSIVEKTREVSSKFDQTYWRGISRRQVFPTEYWNAIARSGLFGMVVSKEYGGLGKSLLDLCLSTEETAERFAGIASYLLLSGCLVSTLFSKSKDEQKERIIPKLAKGDLKISIALSEEKSGLDSSSIETSATKISGGYKISGEKRFVNNVDNADYLVVFARTTPREASAKKSLGVSMFLVPARDNAVRARRLDKLGMDFIGNFDVALDGLIVQDDDLVGQFDYAWYNAVESFNRDRVATSASLIGTGRLALNDATEYAKNRVVFNRAIGSNQGVQFPLADAACQLIVAENMMLKAASLEAQGQGFLDAASFALYSSINAAAAATDRALQTFGGHGYYKDYDVERYWRDVRVHRVHPISEELLLTGIAERSLGLPRSY